MGERRVGLVPASVRELIAHRHTVLLEAGAVSGIVAEMQLTSRGGPPRIYFTFRGYSIETRSSNASVRKRSRAYRSNIFTSVRLDTGLS